MPDLPRPLEHHEPDKKDDGTLKKEAQAHLARTPELQLMAELTAKLRELELPWWSADMLRAAWPASQRLAWFRHRPDIRQRITTNLTGLAPKAARKKTPDFQSGLIDSVIDDGDINAAAFEVAFEPTEVAVYGPMADSWRRLRDRMPWDQDSPVHQELITWLIKALLTEHSELAGMTRKPILTPWEVRTAIDGKIWHTRIPLDIRIAIDEARLEQERSKADQPFHAKHDLAIAIPEIIVESVHLRDLLQVIHAAGRAMGFDSDASPTTHGGGSSVRPGERLPSPSDMAHRTGPPPPDMAHRSGPPPPEMANRGGAPPPSGDALPKAVEALAAGSAARGAEGHRRAEPSSEPSSKPVPPGASPRASAPPPTTAPGSVQPRASAPPPGAAAPTAGSPAMAAPAMAAPAVAPIAMAPPAMASPAVPAPAVAPPAVAPPVVAPFAMALSAASGPAVTAPGAAPPAMASPAVTPPAMALPGSTPPAMAPPAVTPPALIPPAMAPPAGLAPPPLVVSPPAPPPMIASAGSQSTLPAPPPLVAPPAMVRPPSGSVAPPPGAGSSSVAPPPGAGSSSSVAPPALVRPPGGSVAPPPGGSSSSVAPPAMVRPASGSVAPPPGGGSSSVAPPAGGGSSRVASGSSNAGPMGITPVAALAPAAGAPVAGGPGGPRGTMVLAPPASTVPPGSVTQPFVRPTADVDPRAAAKPMAESEPPPPVKGRANMDPRAATMASAHGDARPAFKAPIVTNATSTSSPSPKTVPWNPSQDPEARNSQPTLVLSNLIDEGTVNDDEEDDLERTNPWNIAAIQELGLDDEELRKLGDPKPGEAPHAGPPVGSSKRRRGKFP